MTIYIIYHMFKIVGTQQDYLDESGNTFPFIKQMLHEENIDCVIILLRNDK